MIGFNTQRRLVVVYNHHLNWMKRKGKFELHNWIIQLNFNWIAHAISYPTQAMFKLYKRLLKIERIWLVDSIDKCL